MIHGRKSMSKPRPLPPLLVRTSACPLTIAAISLLQLSAQSCVRISECLDFLERFPQGPLQIRYPLLPARRIQNWSERLL
jgi:hypothetical protein